MAESGASFKPLCELVDGEDATFFALLSAKQLLTTRDGKPYHRVTFRDGARSVSFPIWHDSVWASECRERWQNGEFYKIRATYRESQFGPQLELRKIREVVAGDKDDGFDPDMCQLRCRREPAEMYAELLQLIEGISDVGLRGIATFILREHQSLWLRLPAESMNHHVYIGGLLEHTLHVAITANLVAKQYLILYPELDPPLDIDLVIAGAILHDVGKLRELTPLPTGAEFTPAGDLIGHLVLGRDLVKEAAASVSAQGVSLDAEKLLRLEHIILSHHRLPEMGSPKPPMMPEAILVHYANEIDVKYTMMRDILSEDLEAGHATGKRNILQQKIYRGPR